MKKQFKISIPKPCHEDWSKMTPKEKGRFCQSCSKTVVDFTKKSKEEIQEYLSANYGQRVCGHFRREQLDTVTLEIPSSAFQQNLSFQKLFLLALLIVMGTTLFSCQTSTGKKQRIQEVILIDSIPSISKEIDSLQREGCTQTKDTTEYYTLGNVPFIKKPTSPPPPLTGIVFTPQELERWDQSQQTLDSIEEIEVLDGEIEVDILGDIEPYEEEVEEIEVVLGYIIEEHPKFPESDSLTGEKAKDDFNQRMRTFFDTHFKAPQQNLGLAKKQYRIIAQFEIDTLGKVTDLNIIAPHPAFKKEVERVLKKLPTFIPREQHGKVVNTKYALPIFVDLRD